MNKKEQTPLKGSKSMGMDRLSHSQKEAEFNFSSQINIKEVEFYQKNITPEIRHQQEEDDDEVLQDIQRKKEEESKLLQQIRQKQLQETQNKKMIVGSGFNIDITQFFEFQKKQQLLSEGSILEEISGSGLAWIILLYSVCNASLVPAWIMNIKASKLLRQVWRFLLQALITIPFMLYEYRTLDQAGKAKYSWKYAFNPLNLRKVYVSSFAASMWFLFILSTFEWTYISHCVVLGSLSNFFLSIGRALRKSSHEFETGGQILIVTGVLLILRDSYSLVTSDATQSDHSVINSLYLHRHWWQRVLGDLVAFIVSYVMSELSKYTSDLRSYYPPFLSMSLVNYFNIVNLTLFAYFFNGATFDFDSRWGIFSIFTQTHFAGFMYLAIIISLGQLVSIVMISRMFPDPIIPAFAMTLEPVFASFFVQLAGVQNMPGPIAFVGYLCIVPGLLLILAGQCFFQRFNSKKEAEEQKRLLLEKQMQVLQRMSTVRQEKETKHNQKNFKKQLRKIKQ